VAILAGGRATRLGAIASAVPKAMLPVAGRPFIEHQLEALRAHGARRVVLLVGHLGEAIEAGIGDGRRFGLDVAYSWDDPALDGTAGALRRALPLLGERFLVLYGDAYLRVDYRDADRAHAASGRLALMTVLRNRGRWGTSNAVVRGGLVSAYGKRPPPPGAQWIDYGLSVFRADALRARGEPDLADAVRELAAAGQVAAYPVGKRFYEIGTPGGLAQTEAFLRREPERVS
jgi:NDP-sugar pyrophosphorylase family protein